MLIVPPALPWPHLGPALWSIVQPPNPQDYESWPRVADRTRMVWNSTADPTEATTLEILNRWARRINALGVAPQQLGPVLVGQQFDAVVRGGRRDRSPGTAPLRAYSGICRTPPDSGERNYRNGSTWRPGLDYPLSVCDMVGLHQGGLILRYCLWMDPPPAPTTQPARSGPRRSPTRAVSVPHNASKKTPPKKRCFSRIAFRISMSRLLRSRTPQSHICNGLRLNGPARLLVNMYLC